MEIHGNCYYFWHEHSMSVQFIFHLLCFRFSQATPDGHFLEGVETVDFAELLNLLQFWRLNP